MEVEKEVSSHEQLHLRPVSCVAVSDDGSIIATGIVLSFMQPFLIACVRRS